MNSACIEDFGNNDSSPSLIREIRDTSTAKRQDNKIKNKKRKKQRKAEKRKRLKYQGDSNSEKSNKTKKKKMTQREKTKTQTKNKAPKKKMKGKKGKKNCRRNQKEKRTSLKNKKGKKRSKKNRKGKKNKEKKKTYKNKPRSQAKIEKIPNTRQTNSSLTTNSTEEPEKRLKCDCDTPDYGIIINTYTQNRRLYDKYNFLGSKLEKISVFKSYASLLGKITKNGTTCTDSAKVLSVLSNLLAISELPSLSPNAKVQV